MPQIFFTADQHFGHTNVIRFCNRPFESVEHMHEVMIQRHNERVRQGDRVYHHGDFSFKCPLEYLKRLNGQHYLITGNHDWSGKEHGFIWRKDVSSLSINGEGYIWMSHYPHRSWNRMHYGAIHLYGHEHGSLSQVQWGKSMDVGVDTNNFYPYEWSEIKSIMDGREVLAHHEPRHEPFHR
jgi:calcineurin-like phosphoesterase family protein